MKSIALIEPQNDCIIKGNTLEFVFIVPFDEDKNLLLFRIEFDKNNPPISTSSFYKVNELRLSKDQKSNGTWQVDDCSGNFVNMSIGGIGPEYYGRNAKIIIKKQNNFNFPDSKGRWFWKISCLSYISKFDVSLFGKTFFI